LAPHKSFTYVLTYRLLLYEDEDRAEANGLNRWRLLRSAVIRRQFHCTKQVPLSSRRLLTLPNSNLTWTRSPAVAKKPHDVPWVCRFLTAHQHIKGYLVPCNG